MKFRFIWIGRTKDRNLKALQEEYLRRLSHFVRCETVELREAAGGPNAVEQESQRIRETLNPKSFVCLLDVRGTAVTSEALAAKIEKWQVDGLREIDFVIGGANGVSRAVAEMADFSLSLSILTFTHEMARVLLLEQLYRANTIIKGFPYQK